MATCFLAPDPQLLLHFESLKVEEYFSTDTHRIFTNKMVRQTNRAAKTERTKRGLELLNWELHPKAPKTILQGVQPREGKTEEIMGTTETNPKAMA